MQKIVLATGNAGKVEEMKRFLSTLGFDVIPQSEFKLQAAEETGLSFIENAIIKARHAAAHCGLPAIADDSGLEVDALQGAPGIYSARYAAPYPHNVDKDQANNEKLLSALNGCDNRRARFQCVLVFMHHANDPTPLIASGTWQGEIALQAKGCNGFGYDPVFICEQHRQHSAELSPAIKHQISHRALALNSLKAKLHQTC